MSRCFLCPRRCGADRESSVGFCGVSDKIKIARAAPHFFEEPVISGERGSGAIFFSGCPLRCVYCQNYSLSHNSHGLEISEERLEEIILKLEKSGVHNINLVSPTQFALPVSNVLKRIKKDLSIPVILNTSGYESEETHSLFEGLIDVFLPDLKYFSPELSKKYSGVSDYFEVAIQAIERMIKSVGAPVIEDGLIKKGVIIRHLLLPGLRRDSERLLYELRDRFGTESFLLSLMHQYTPEFLEEGFPELRRRVTEFEYNFAKNLAAEIGFKGFSQDKTSATAKFTPDFNLENLISF